MLKEHRFFFKQMLQIAILFEKYFTNFGQYNLLHVRNRGRILHVFSQILFLHFLRLSTFSPVQMHKKIKVLLVD